MASQSIYKLQFRNAAYKSQSLNATNKSQCVNATIIAVVEATFESGKVPDTAFQIQLFTQQQLSPSTTHSNKQHSDGEKFSAAMNPETSNNQTNPTKRTFAEIDKPATINCMVVAIDHSNLYYTVCSVCEKTLSDPSPNTHFPNSSLPFCKYCNFNNNGFFNPAPSGSKRLFRVLVSNFFPFLKKNYSPLSFFTL